MPVRTSLLSRMAAVRARVAAGETGPDLARELDDVLSEGYAAAHQLDAERRRVEARVEALSEEPPEHDAGTTLRDLSTQRRRFGRDAAELRAELAELQAAFTRLGGARFRR